MLDLKCFDYSNLDCHILHIELIEFLVLEFLDVQISGLGISEFMISECGTSRLLDFSIREFPDVGKGTKEG